ncbi:MFS transporter [Streptomyces sp. NPDC053086]|uniref:MFS transporter n=1 Tax=unclassified Streptomyces TaxID=2593676 RepID=UPI0037D29EF4
MPWARSADGAERGAEARDDRPADRNLGRRTRPRPGAADRARIVQGSRAAMVAPAALSLTTTGFAEGPRRTRALGLYGATASVGFVAGQVLGGVLVNFLSWPSVFLVNVPVGLTAVLLAPHVLRESRLARAGRHMDISGAVLITLTVGSLVFDRTRHTSTAVGERAAMLAALPAAALATLVALMAWYRAPRHGVT